MQTLNRMQQEHLWRDAVSAGPVLAGCDYSTEEVEAEGPQVSGQPRLYRVTCVSKKQKLKQAKHMDTKKEEDLLEN